jgi:hypothetical protein
MMTNVEIDHAVRRLAGLALRDVHPKPHEEEAIQAGVNLAMNFLQNINTIALAAHEGVFDR